MKAFISGLVAMAVIGGGAWFVLTNGMDYSTMTVNTSHKNDAVRLDPEMGEHRAED